MLFLFRNRGNGTYSNALLNVDVRITRNERGRYLNFTFTFGNSSRTSTKELLY